MSFTPFEQPAFGLAARALVRSLREQPDTPARAQTLIKLSRDLGDTWFPLYLKLLIVVGNGADPEEQALLADAVAHGLQHGQTAAGTLGSWGVPAPFSTQLSALQTLPLPATAPVQAGRGFLRMSAARGLDPLAYLIVWFSQSTARAPLPAAVFEDSLAALLRLFDSSASAKSIYQAKLRADVTASVDGTYNATSLLRIGALVDAWSAGQAPHRVAATTTQTEPKPLRAGGYGLPGLRPV
jgi:hypothetical protein